MLAHGARKGLADVKLAKMKGATLGNPKRKVR
jgi:hypothetical protein